MPRVQAITPCLWFDDQRFTALNGGPAFKLSEGGDPDAQQCGWLKDRFGVSWQVTPRILLDMLADPDPARSRRTMEEVLKVKKFDIAALERVHGS